MYHAHMHLDSPHSDPIIIVSSFILNYNIRAKVHIGVITSSFKVLKARHAKARHAFPTGPSLNIVAEPQGSTH